MERSHEARVDLRHLAFYGVMLVVIAVVGIVAIWSFIQRQSLVIQPEPLPKITIVTQNASSKLAADWVRLLTKAELQPTLVPLETFDPIEGVVVFCDVEVIPPRLAEQLAEFVRRGGAVTVVGKPPVTPIGRFRLIHEQGRSDRMLRLSEFASPLLARTVPGQEVPVRPGNVTMLKETPRMVVDARWAENSRAAVMHMQLDGARYLWFGFEPEAFVGQHAATSAMLRAAFRWVSGQPVSDGAIGLPQEAKTLTPAARREARENGFAYSVDRTRDEETFTVRMINRGGIPLLNPTVKIWLPPYVTRIALDGDFIMRRSATLTGLPEDGTCLVSLPRLTRNEERVMKLRITGIRRAKATQSAER